MLKLSICADLKVNSLALVFKVYRKYPLRRYLRATRIEYKSNSAMQGIAILFNSKNLFEILIFLKDF